MRQSDATFALCPLAFPTKTWRAFVVRVVDGDTVVLRIDRGFFDDTTLDIRFADVNAYEVSDPSGKGKLARDLVRTIAEGRWCVVDTAMDPDKYGRILGRLFVWDGAQMVDVSQSLRDAGLVLA